jgi:hypothetical protein
MYRSMFVDRCRLPPPHDIQGDRLVGVAAEAFDFEVEVAGIQRVAQGRGGLARSLKRHHPFVPSLAGEPIGLPACLGRPFLGCADRRATNALA